MPYQSRAERVRTQWRTLPEAAVHIRDADGCDQEDARRQLRKALADGALGPLRWEDGRPTPSAGGATVPFDMPPSQDPHWADVDIDWGAGTARDDWGEAGPRHRVLLIHRLALRRHWPEMSPVADWDDPDRYEAQGARRSRKAREEREAYDVAWNAAWEAECSKPIKKRQWFQVGDLADELARDPRTLAIDEPLQTRIIENLTDWIRRQQFDLAGGEVATLSDDPPTFQPIEPLAPTSMLADPRSLMLRRDACRRFIDAHTALPNGAELLRRWFGPYLPAADEGQTGYSVYFSQNLQKRIAERRAQDAADAAVDWVSYPSAVQLVLPVLFGRAWVGLASEQEKVVLRIGTTHPGFPRFSLINREREEQIERAERWLSINGLVEDRNGGRRVQAARLQEVLAGEARALKPDDIQNGGAQKQPASGDDRTQVGAKRDIPKTVLLRHLKAMKGDAGPAPACDPLVVKISGEFPQYRVTWAAVRSVHGEVFGKLPRGKRSKIGY